MTYDMVVEVGTKQIVIPFTVDFEGAVEVDQHSITRVMKLWHEQQPEGKAHWVIRPTGQLTVIYYNEDGEQVVNDAYLDGNWNMAFRWFESLIPGQVWWGPPIGQPNPSDIVKATDAAEAVAGKFSVADGEQWFTITDMKMAAREAALAALAGA